MKNVFSVNEQTPELDPSFANQAQAQRGGPPSAPSTPAILPAHSPVPLPGPLEQIAEIAAPGSATSNSLTYRWRA
jgi:hypothetical protein